MGSDVEKRGKESQRTLTPIDLFCVGKWQEIVGLL